MTLTVPRDFIGRDWKATGKTDSCTGTVWVETGTRFARDPLGGNGKLTFAQEQFG